MANLNTAQIMGAAKNVWGRDISDQEAQTIMNSAKGGEAQAVDQYLRNDATYLTGKMTAERNALNAQQKGQQDEFLGRFRTAVEGQEKLPDMAGRIGGELGLPGLQQVAGSAVQNLAQMPKVQTDAARGYNVNSNQLARIIGQKQSELAPQAQQAVTQQQNAENQLSTRLGYEVAQQQKELTPFATEQSMMSEQLAREYSGFTQEKQNQLQLAMQSIANGQQLTMQSLQNANQLALAKMQYDNTKQDVTKYMAVSEGQSIIDPSTGKLIYSQPKTYKPLTGTAASGWGQQ